MSKEKKIGEFYMAKIMYDPDPGFCLECRIRTLVFLIIYAPGSL